MKTKFKIDETVLEALLSGDVVSAKGTNGVEVEFILADIGIENIAKVANRAIKKANESINDSKGKD